MASRMRTALAASLFAFMGLTTAHAQGPIKITLFGQPSVNNFPSGTTAFQTFQTGQGDIVMTGDLPSVQYFFRTNGNYRTIAAMERDAKGYVAVARKDVRTPADLAGKTIATRVGSTWVRVHWRSAPDRRTTSPTRRVTSRVISSRARGRIGSPPRKVARPPRSSSAPW